MGLTISNLKQVALHEAPTSAILGVTPDIAVVSPGKTRRCRFFQRALGRVSKTAFAPSPSNAGSEATESATHFSEGSLTADLHAIVEAIGPSQANWQIFVDVSCIPRTAIAEALSFCVELAKDRPVDLRLAYSLAAYAAPRSEWAKANRAIRPVHPAFSGWTSEGASAPLDVVVGLGYEKGKATGAVEYLEPRNRWVWVPHSPVAEYLAEVHGHNKYLLDPTSQQVSHYEVLAPVETYFALRSQVEGISKEARPVLLPFGPKIFFAVSLLVAMTVEEAAVWHVSGESDDLGERKPSRYSTILSCTIAPT